MSAKTSNIVAADTAGIAHAADMLRHGGLVAFPTETVYGLGADAANDDAVAGIFEAKGRPRFNPLITHVCDFSTAAELANFTPAAVQLAERFWPGPLTLVLPRRPKCPLSLLVSAGLDTVALRVPAHPIARALLDASECAIAAPSANRSGHVSPTTAQHVAGDFGTRLDVILDGGKATHGLESTVVGFVDDRAVLLRTGAIAREEIEHVVGALGMPSGGRISSPGQLASHYAPRTPLRLNAQNIEPGEALLAFGIDLPHGGAMVRNLSAGGDLKEAAANLFAMLRELDATGATCIAVMPVPDRGLGEAINDRLRRAATLDKRS